MVSDHEMRTVARVTMILAGCSMTGKKKKRGKGVSRRGGKKGEGEGNDRKLAHYFDPLRKVFALQHLLSR